MIFRSSTQSGQDIWINPKHVTHIVRQDEKTSVIHFSGGETAVVKQAAHELASEVDAYLQAARDDEE